MVRQNWTRSSAATMCLNMLQFYDLDSFPESSDVTWVVYDLPDVFVVSDEYLSELFS